ncbi:MAG: hypothetical protein QNI92_15335 [Desulfobacterales bacterium]|nr:hypothetical protein [Desulfobacterales bacterium]
MANNDWQQLTAEISAMKTEVALLRKDIMQLKAHSEKTNEALRRMIEKRKDNQKRIDRLERFLEDKFEAYYQEG